MKKRLLTLLSLVMAFVLCFSLAACGGDKGGNNGSEQGKQDPPQADNTVSISVNDAIDAVNDVLNAQGFTGTASYTLSTKNTKALTDNVTLDKRGNKLKIASKNNETIIDFQTGYVYYKYGDHYAYDHEFYANAFDYAQYLLASLEREDGAKKINAVYDEEAKTVTFTVEKADSVNKYLTPLQSAYKYDKTLGALLDDYCQLLFGKSFDATYNVIMDYVKDPENTVGTLLDALKEKGLDVEAILETFEFEVDEAIMAAVKARKLNELVAGAFKFIMTNMGDMIPLELNDVGENDAVDQPAFEEGEGMASLGMGLLQAMLFDEVSEQEITVAMKGMDDGIALVKNTFKVQTVIDMALKNNAKAVDLYTVIKDGVVLKNATTTFTLTVDDNKAIKGVKFDNYLAHNYKGEAAEGSILADNDYRATVEIKIDEYTTPTEDFAITCDPEEGYRASIISLLYEVTDKNVSLYFEAGGKTVNVTVAQGLSLETLDGEVSILENVPEGAFKFDAATSSFVFDGAVVKSALENADFGTTLFALVYFDGDVTDLYAIGLAYVNDDWQAIGDYLYQNVMDSVLDFIGGHDTPDTPVIKSTAADGTYYYFTDNGELDDSYYWVIEDGELVTCICNGDDMTEYAEVKVYESDSSETTVDVIIQYPADGDDPAYRLTMLGTLKETYVQIEMQIVYDENDEWLGATHGITIMYRGDESELTDYDGKYVMYDDGVQVGNAILIIGGEFVCITDGGYIIADMYESVIDENEIVIIYQSGDWTYGAVGTIENGVITLIERDAYEGEELMWENDEVVYYVRGGGQPNTAMNA
ncbi:MAG: hypothetical protein K2I75_00405 [Clostridiales bacterium]|nr:hypothetical protein [Clostridiales bacterium]